VTETDVLDISRQTFFVILQAGGPVMAAGLAIGLVVAVLQTLTSIQEMTLTFVPKIIVIFGAILLFMPFMITTLIDFTHSLFDRIVAG
jgi:flagellar biosynthetic protein FliQ